ncbi:MAG: hypothetical protein IT456_16790 [Planctomycetes bacterium]|nr:hypothetical protein [Planctomycetota bacterium]
MRNEEKAVAGIIEAIRVGSRMEYSRHQSHGECDFLLHDGDGVYPFEVTRHTNARSQEMNAAILGRDGRAAFLDRHLAQKDWWIFPSRNANIRRVRAQADRLLADIESEGLSEFDVNTNGASPAVQRIWNEISVLYGTHMPWSPAGRIGIATPGGGGFLSGDEVVCAIECEAAKEDNRRKLGTDADERHLCVYVDYLGYPAHSVMLAGLLPSQEPDLPPEVTHLWVICDFGEGPEYIVWSFARGGQWKNHGTFIESASPDA